MSKKSMKNIPKVRFPEFVNEPEWKKIKLSKLGKLVSGLTYSPDDVREDGLLVLRSSNVQDGEIKLEDNVYVRTDIKGANLSEPNDILICVRNGSKALIGKNALIPDNMPLCTHGAFMTIFRAELPKFVFQLFQTKDYERQVNADLGATINSINGNKFIKYEFYVPTNEKEQEKIADCLSSLDSLIIAQGQKVEFLKEHKKGLLQNLFPKDGEGVPKYRFSEFVNDEEWEEKQLGDLLDYEQPTKYLINDTKYDDSYKTPVLTAGKTFILGYTDETNGIFRDSLPIIIFDDFTTATQFVDFPFKAKSSAMKILKTKSNEFSIKLIFELIQRIDYKADEHKRYWISEYQNITIKLPKPKEQQKIADCLTSIDGEINLQIQKVELLKKHKKALLQQLFPSNGVING
ncbi:restriction endonuclease subunit S [Aliarcobacter butzleri]|uniref:restriction endonuclease subunit S n=1 Tax=Aliarcobacter butzleri TaxID=28197 RepID=UPI0013EE5D3F|nr:restriction endonuclease subunit S [Aliarcobacter butzleri]